MNKLSILFLAAAGLALASCSQDDINNNSAAGDGFTFTVNLPSDFSTRGMTDGSAATQLYFAVYDAATELFVLDDYTSFPENQNSTEVKLDLVSGKDYYVTFFAYSSANGVFSTDASDNAVYTLDTTTGLLTVNYAGMTAENMATDSYDCFFSVENTSETSTSADVTLTRPIAQINWGSAEMASSSASGSPAFGETWQYVTPALSTKAYNTFSFLTGDVPTDAEPVDVEINGFAVSSTTEYPVTGYNYLAMQYILAPKATSANYDLTLTVNNTSKPGVADGEAKEVEIVIPVSSAPLQANYQTNIYGSLLTTNISFAVSKYPNWTSQFNQGTDLAEEITPDTNGDYPVATQGNFLWLAQQVNNGESFAGKNFYLKNDIYFTVPVTPIGTNINNNSKPFAGNFDGKDFTIHNLVVNNDVNTGGTGLFGYCFNPNYQTFENINIENATVDGYANNVGALIGYAGRCYISNIQVTGNLQVEGHNGLIGGVVGYLFAGTLENIVVSVDSESFVKSTNVSSNNVGGIVGQPDWGVSAISDLTSNVNVQGGGFVGGIMGRVQALAWPEKVNTITIENCKAECDVKSLGFNNNVYFVGGISGSWYKAANETVYFSGCSYNGTISSAYGVPSDVTYDLQTKNEITGPGVNSQNVGTLYIGNTTTNVGPQHLLPDVPVN